MKTLIIFIAHFSILFFATFFMAKNDIEIMKNMFLISVLSFSVLLIVLSRFDLGIKKMTQILFAKTTDVYEFSIAILVLHCISLYYMARSPEVSWQVIVAILIVMSTYIYFLIIYKPNKKDIENHET